MSKEKEKDKEQEKDKEMSAEAVLALQGVMIEKELMKMSGYAPLVKTLIDFGIRGFKALQFISTFSAYAEKGNDKEDG